MANGGDTDYSDPESRHSRPQHRALVIDPGTENLGVSVGDWVDNRLYIRHSATVDVEKLVRLRYKHVEYRIGHRPAACYAIHHFLLKMCQTWQPSTMVSETPYMKRVFNPMLQSAALQSFVILYDVVESVRRMVFENFPTMQFVGIDPSTAKASLSVPGNSGDKDLVYQAIKRSQHIDHSEIFIDQGTEHSRDSILIMNSYFYHTVENGFLLPEPYWRQ